MKTKNWMDLGPRDRKALSCVKTGVILHLMSFLPKGDVPSADAVKQQNFRLNFSGGKSLRWQLQCTDGSLSVNEGQLRHGSLTLWGRKEEEIGALLTDRMGKVIPLPGSFRFASVARIFKLLASRIPLYLGGEEGKKNKEFQTLLMLEAALMGVVQVANYDPYVQTRKRKMSDGIIEVYIEDKPEWTRYVEIDYGRFYLRKSCDEKPSARLIFQDKETAHAIFSNKVRAMSALGDGRIRIRGRLPLIQGLFPLLDRFSWLMSVK